MCPVIGVRGNSSLGNKRHHKTLRLGQLPSSQGWEKRPHDSLTSQWTAPPIYLYMARIKVWGLHIKQTEAFDVDGNTNTEMSSRNSLFVPFSHSLSCLLNVYVFKGLQHAPVVQ